MVEFGQRSAARWISVADLARTLGVSKARVSAAARAVGASPAEKLSSGHAEAIIRRIRARDGEKILRKTEVEGLAEPVFGKRSRNQQENR
jgi:hypothetical protein